MQPFKRVPANKQCCDLLELYLARAKEGRINFVGVVACEESGSADDYIGDTRSYYAANFRLDILKRKLVEAAVSAQIGPTTEGAPANMWSYDLSAEPACFDFVAWLITAEMIRRREGAPAPLRVGFLQREDDGSTEEGRAQRMVFFNKVILPSLELFGAVNDPIAATYGRHHESYALKEITEAARNGEEIPVVNVPGRAAAAVAAHLRGRFPVTITLRENATWEHRNSNICAWEKFAYWLMEEFGEDVIVIRDTATALEPFGTCETFPLASTDLHARSAIYEKARCNLFVANGPAILAHFGTRPWLTFVTVDPNESYRCNRPEWWEKYHGIAKGQQFPWSGPRQRIVWSDDTFENIKDAWLKKIVAN